MSPIGCHDGSPKDDQVLILNPHQAPNESPMGCIGEEKARTG